MPTNVMWEGTSDFWRNDDFVDFENGARDWGKEYEEPEEGEEAAAGAEDAAKRE